MDNIWEIKEDPNPSYSQGKPRFDVSTEWIEGNEGCETYGADGTSRGSAVRLTSSTFPRPGKDHSDSFMAREFEGRSPRTEKLGDYCRSPVRDDVSLNWSSSVGGKEKGFKTTYASEPTAVMVWWDWVRAGTEDCSQDPDVAGRSWVVQYCGLNGNLAKAKRPFLFTFPYY